MINLSSEEVLFYKQLMDKHKICFSRDIPVFTDFLNLHEQSIFHSNIKEFSMVNHSLFGGYDEAERKMLVFYPEYIEITRDDYPFHILEIKPRNEKFSNKLTHRDYLGAILNLGITRNKIGDIIVHETDAYVFVSNKMSSFISDQLFSIKQTDVVTHRVNDLPEHLLQPKYKVIQGTIASLRLDAVVRLAFPISRGKAADLIKASKVYVNSKLITSPSFSVKYEDVVSIRGHGKFKISHIGEKTKKDRIYIGINKYI